MIDTVLKLWPLITGGSAGAWVTGRYVWQRRSATRTAAVTKKEKAEQLAEQALQAAQSKTDAATSEHTDWLELELEKKQKEIDRLNSVLEVAHASEVEAWRRARTSGRESS